MSRAETTTQFFAEHSQNARALMGENPGTVLSKACLQPSEVTDEELFVLEGYFRSIWALADRSHRLEMVAEFGMPWQEIVRQSLQPVVRFEHGRKWLATNSASINPNLEKLVLEMLNENENMSCKDSLNALRLDG